MYTTEINLNHPKYVTDYGKGTGYKKRQKILNELFDGRLVTCLTNNEQFNDLSAGIYAMVDYKEVA